MEKTTTKKQRLLVGGMHAQGILLTTPLLKLYLNGMIISNIELILENQPEKCFQKFTDEVTISKF